MLGFLPPSLAGPHIARNHRGARGFTLVELLVASTIGLIVMGSLATLLGLFSRTSSNAQSIVSMTHAMRVVGSRLRSDLAGVTVELRPPVNPESDSGYFELIEGPRSDSYDWVARGVGAVAEKKPITAIIAGEVDRDGNPPVLDPVGDIDDLLLFTTRSAGKPFTGRYGDGNIESSAAEVAWFLKTSATQPIAGVTVYNLYRKQLLVLAYVGAAPFASGTNRLIASGTLPFVDFYRNYDISVRAGEVAPAPNQATTLYPNTLADLTRRENRFNRRVVWPFTDVFPFPFQRTNEPQATFDATAREGEDIVLRNVLAFDVRVFDPDAPMKQIRNVAVPGGPGDIGYADIDATYFAPNARGTYADLGWGAELAGGSQRVTTRLFQFPIDPAFSPTSSAVPPLDNWFPGSEDADRDGFFDTGEDADGSLSLNAYTPWQGYGMQLRNTVVTYGAANGWGGLFPGSLSYDTWSTHYESNGINEDGDFEPDGVTSLVDEGTDGRDNNNDGIPDDPAERETSPPYPVPLRGIEIRIRCIEPTTKEIRQITIRHAFDQS